MLLTKKRLRIAGSGRSLRVITLGNWRQEPLDAISEACRAQVAIQKLLHESVAKAINENYTWEEIGHRLGMEGVLAKAKFSTPFGADSR
jgi:hypothetical protein